MGAQVLTPVACHMNPTRVAQAGIATPLANANVLHRNAAGQIIEPQSGFARVPPWPVSASLEGRGNHAVPFGAPVVDRGASHQSNLPCGSMETVTTALRTMMAPDSQQLSESDKKGLALM